MNRADIAVFLVDYLIRGGCDRALAIRFAWILTGYLVWWVESGPEAAEMLCELQS